MNVRLPNLPESARRCLEHRLRLLTSPQSEWLDICLRESRSCGSDLRAWTAIADPEPRSDEEVVPFGVKDVIDVAGFATQAGSRSRAEAATAMMDAAVVSRLRAIGMAPIGKTKTTEFAYVDSTDTHNPFNPQHTPGGSSSGSAAAVGAGNVPLALGTQTAGSVCRPAAFCGTFAYKPTTGLTPNEGLIPFAPSFDTIGTFGLTLELTLQAGLAIAGARPLTATAMEAASGRRLNVGLLDDPYYRAISAPAAAAVDRAASALRASGHQVVTLQLGLDFAELRLVHRRVMQFEAFRAHGSLLGRPELLGSNWCNALKAGSSLGDADHEADLQRLREARDRSLQRLQGLDAMVLPPALGTAPAGLESTGDAGLIIPWTYIGSPLVVLPVGLSDEGLPLAVMVAGQPGQDLKCAGDSWTIHQALRAHKLSLDTARWP